MKPKVEAQLRDIRTDHLQEWIAHNPGLSVHMLLRMFVLALHAQHVTVVGRGHRYVQFDDLAAQLVNQNGTQRIELPYREIEAIAREAMARLTRLTPGDPVGEWIWACSGAAHPNYATAEIVSQLSEADFQAREPDRPWIPACVRESYPPPPEIREEVS